MLFSSFMINGPASCCIYVTTRREKQNNWTWLFFPPLFSLTEIYSLGVIFNKDDCRHTPVEKIIGLKD